MVWAKGPILAPITAPAEAAPAAAPAAHAAPATVPHAAPPAHAPAAGGVVQGIAGAPGIAIGPVFRFERAEVMVNERFGGIDFEHARLQAAIDAARQQLNKLHAEVAQRADASQAEISTSRRSWPTKR